MEITISENELKNFSKRTTSMGGRINGRGYGGCSVSIKFFNISDLYDAYEYLLNVNQDDTKTLVGKNGSYTGISKYDLYKIQNLMTIKKDDIVKVHSVDGVPVTQMYEDAQSGTSYNRNKFDSLIAPERTIKKFMDYFEQLQEDEGKIDMLEVSSAVKTFLYQPFSFFTYYKKLTRMGYEEVYCSNVKRNIYCREDYIEKIMRSVFSRYDAPVFIFKKDKLGCFFRANGQSYYY